MSFFSDNLEPFFVSLPIFSLIIILPENETESYSINTTPHTTTFSFR